MFTSVRVEHALNLIRVIRFRERQRQQQAGFPGLEVIARYEAALGQAGASDDSAGGNPAA